MFPPMVIYIATVHYQNQEADIGTTLLTKNTDLIWIYQFLCHESGVFIVSMTFYHMYRFV